MALLTTTFSNVLNNRNYYARIYPVNPQGSMQSELYGQVTTDYVTPTGGISLSQLSEGSIVMIPEDGVDTAFYVAKHDYESGLNGTGRVLMVRKDVHSNQVWDSGNVNAYVGSDIDVWLTNTYLSTLDAKIQELIDTTKFYYTPGNGNTTVSTLERSVFVLSATELSRSSGTGTANAEGSALPIASSLQIAYLNGSVVVQWTRTPTTNSTLYAHVLNTGGGITSNGCFLSYGVRPCFTLPSDMQLSKIPNEDGSYNILTFPEEPSGYELIETVTTSQEWVAPENGWYQVEVFGASGYGGNGSYSTWNDEEGWECNAVRGGSGGGGGAYAKSNLIKLNAGDTIMLTIGQSGETTTVVINSSTGETYNTISCTSGANYPAVNTIGTGGIATGGNVENTNGGNGAIGEYGYKQGGTVGGSRYGGAGGLAAHALGNAGGKGAAASNGTAAISGTRGAGAAGFVRISYGTNDATPNEVYLLNYSDRCTDISGGWNLSYKFQNNAYMTTGTNSCLRVAHANTDTSMGGGIITTGNTIDLTNYSYITISGFHNNDSLTALMPFGAFVSISIPNTLVSSSTGTAWSGLTTSDVNKEFTIKVDVSSLSGKYYICIQCPNNAPSNYADIYTVQLIK